MGDPSLTTEPGIDALARQFLSSAYAESGTYANWPLDRRLEGFLRRQELDFLVEDGDAYDLVLDRVMVCIGEAARRRFDGGPDRRRASMLGTSVPVGDAH